MSVTSVLSFLAYASYLTIHYMSINHGLAKTELTETAKFAVTLYLERLQSFGQLSLALVGALWVFGINKESEASSFPTKHHAILFGISTIFLIASFGFYLLGNSFIVDRMFYHSAFDLSAPIVKFWENSQFYSFVLGSVFLAVTFYYQIIHKGDEAHA